MTGDLSLRVQQMRWEAEGVLSIELCALDHAPLPAWEVGAHIDVQLPNGLTRSYSLVNQPEDNRRYVIAVARDRESRGGSAYVHRSLRPGQQLEVHLPRNHFRLIPGACPVVLIAGGIGVTPLYAMANALTSARRPFQFIYACRSRSQAAFIEAIGQFGERTHLHIDDESGGALLDLTKIIASAPGDAHFYCCGPSGMLAAFERAAASLPAERVHVERFSAPPVAAAPPAEAFKVILARSRRELVIPADQSILAVLLAAGIRVPYSCTDGLCGSCETGVLAGEPVHRDFVLSAAERAANTTMMVCVSRCKGDALTLDL